MPVVKCLNLNSTMAAPRQSAYIWNLVKFYPTLLKFMNKDYQYNNILFINIISFYTIIADYSSMYA